MEMFQYEFIQRALIAGLAMSFITPIIGLFLILRQQSLLADTLSHISLAGVALGLLLHISPTYATLLVVVLASLGIEYLRTIYRDFSEISVALMMSTGMALALVLLSLNTSQSNFQVDQFLFGSIILIQANELKLLVTVAILVMALYLIFRKPLYVVSFDEATARTSGLPVKFISTCFSVLTGVAISIMMPIVGALLVSALIVIPSATAIRIARSFNQSIVIGIIINMLGILVGLVCSFNYDTPPGASITLSFMGIFLIVTLGQKIYQTFQKKRQANLEIRS
ncbi:MULTISPECIES: metal ABC transporter permease [Facklamia]|uniref:Metal ABC transporter permease n=1 Tax=Facklamia hominis TaxID=178214 RepID=A0AAJ1Q4X3_9LACT|nr:metal ABC transporter permease [Facklamia sp. HMSC062C11]MDK7186914.1 metal ABC transporter permease [Facklamia hominis]OFL65650.1 zinc ABC transporter permease [Facklamia sp. HMSC062C11]